MEKQIKQKRYEVVSLHPFTECNMDPPCPFCYKMKSDKSLEKPESFWLDMIPYVKQISNQIAMGGGEPFMNVGFINRFAKKCRFEQVIFNVTTNGKKLMSMTDSELRSALKGITMISISYDDYKIKNKKDQEAYFNLLRRVKQQTSVQVGSNLLINNNMFKDNGKGLYNTVNLLFKGGVDRVFCLYPKNMPNAPDILKFKEVYTLLTMKYKHFYVDDLTKMILQEGKYKDWKNACHYGKNLISINELGLVTACSFCPNSEALLKIEKPKDLLKVEKIKTQDRFNCPYLIK
jgi:MoaA/NifB/PqqE/SkfB family radical SAM enzyme